jgi:hypothetical protein
MVQKIKPPGRKLKSIIERVEDIERTQQGILQALNQLMIQANERFNNQAEITAAIAEHIGPEKVKQLVEELRDRQDAELVAKAIKYLEGEIDAGRLQQIETMSAKSTVVGVEVDKDGKAIRPGRVQIPFTNIMPELQEQLLGKPAGTRVETKGGTTFEVLEVYEPVEQAAGSSVPVEVPETESDDPSTLAPADELEQLEAAAEG